MERKMREKKNAIWKGLREEKNEGIVKIRMHILCINNIIFDNYTINP